jgi:hypothetical protein
MGVARSVNAEDSDERTAFVLEVSVKQKDQLFSLVYFAVRERFRLFETSERLTQ